MRRPQTSTTSRQQVSMLTVCRDQRRNKIGPETLVWGYHRTFAQGGRSERTMM